MTSYSSFSVYIVILAPRWRRSCRAGPGGPYHVFEFSSGKIDNFQIPNGQMSAEHIQVNLQIKHVSPTADTHVCKHHYRIWKDGYMVESLPDPFGSPLRPLCTKCDKRFERTIPSCKTIKENSFEPGSPKDEEIVKRFLQLTGYTPPPAPRKPRSHRRVVPTPVGPKHSVVIDSLPDAARDPTWIDKLVAEDFTVRELTFNLPDSLYE